MLTKEWVAQNTKKNSFDTTLCLWELQFSDEGPICTPWRQWTCFQYLLCCHNRQALNWRAMACPEQVAIDIIFVGLFVHTVFGKRTTFGILTSAENLGCAWSVLFGKSVGTSGSSALAKFFWIGWIKGSTASVVAMVPTVEKHGETNLTNEEVLNSGVHDFARTSNRLSVIDKRRIPWIIAWSVTQRMPSFCLNFCHKNSSFGNMCSMTENVHQCVTQLSCGAHFAKSAVLAAKQHSEVWPCVSSLSAIFFEHCWVCVRIFWCVHFKIWIL